MKRIVFWICILTLGVCLALTLACGTEDAAETTPVETPAVEPETVETVIVDASATAAPTAEPVRTLHVDQPTDAETLSRTIREAGTIETVVIDPGTMRNADVAALLTAFPNVAFDYAVQLGEDFFGPETAELSIEDGTIQQLADALPCLPNLKTVHLGVCTPEELRTIEASLPGIELTYSLRIYGREVESDAETLDLSDLDALLPDELVEALPYLQNLKTVSLGMREDAAIAEAFRKAAPSVEIDCPYRVNYLGLTLTSDAETLVLSDNRISDLDELKRVIEQLPKLSRVEMIDCGLDNETMAALCDAYPNVRFIWEIDLGYWGKLRTDATAFSTRYSKSDRADKNRMSSEKAQYIRYCSDLVALDLGHQRLTDISFLRPLKNLRVLILADNYILDIGVLAELTELEYIELFMNRVEDVSPLANLNKLTDLNICSNKISDFTPLCSVKTLQRLWYTKNKYSSKDHQMLKEALPDCVLNHTDTGTDGGWRFSGNGKERSEREKWKNAFFEGAPRFV